MKGKRKATASLNPGLIDAVEVPVVEGSVDEVKRRDGFADGDNGENQEREVEGEGEEEEEEEDEEEEEEEEEEEDDGEGEEAGGVGGGEEERPKLDEGFFEIEAIRRKRVRKGQLQYLIKWRGWPETSNTWEPLENLQSCSDVIDAFEERLHSGKSSRKRRRKYWGPHTQPKKRPRSSATYNLTEIEVGVVDKPSALINSSLANLPAPSSLMGSGHERGNDENVDNLGMAKQADENGSLSGSKQVLERKGDYEYDPKLSELRGTVPTNNPNADNLAIQFQEGMPLEANGPASGLHNVGYMEPVQSNRHTGAKRRKSGSVKRFRKELTTCEPLLVQNSSSHVTIGAGASTLHVGTENPILTGANSTYRSLSEDLRNESAITKILKPIGFSASVVDNVQDVLVTFAAMRSDGKEVVVNNQFLKANNPLLLINFYEQHLKYNA